MIIYMKFHGIIKVVGVMVLISAVLSGCGATIKQYGVAEPDKGNGIKVRMPKRSDISNVWSAGIVAQARRTTTSAALLKGKGIRLLRSGNIDKQVTATNLSRHRRELVPSW